MSLLKELAAKANRKAGVIPGKGRPRRKPAPEDCLSPKHHLDGQLDMVPTNVVESPHEDELRISETEDGTGTTLSPVITTDLNSYLSADDSSPTPVFEYGFTPKAASVEPEQPPVAYVVTEQIIGNAIPKAKPPRARKHKKRKVKKNAATIKDGQADS